MTWFYAQLAGLVYEYGYWRRSVSMLEQSRWLRSIDIISGRNSIQAAENNKYADKDKYKWAVNMIYLIYIHLQPSMQIVLASTWSLANIYAHMQFFMTMWNNFTMRHELGWIVIKCHNCCMNGRNLWIIHIPSCSPILDVPTFEQCNLSSRTNQSRTSASINPFLVKFNRPTCGIQEIVSLPISQPLGRILRI